jgi:hypothetical protein
MSDLVTLPGELVGRPELETARGLALEEIAASTLDGYRHDGHLFATWCAARNLPPVPTAATIAASSSTRPRSRRSCRHPDCRATVSLQSVSVPSW